jgi:hypothetical protein
VDKKEIILADRWNDQGISGFYITSVVLLAVRYQLLASFQGNFVFEGVNIGQTKAWTCTSGAFRMQATV